MPSELSVAIKLRRGPHSGFTLDVNFQIAPGITILSGPSGAGKSTILQAIAGLIRPDEGKIVLGGEVWYDERTLVAAYRRSVAYVFQSLALFPHLTVLENVVYGVERKLSKTDRQSRALSMLERMRIVELAPRKTRTLSGGEAQRVALARAFAMRPRVVLLDEPFTALDRDLHRELLALVANFARESAIPFLLVTHDREEARALGQNMILVEGGRVVQTGRVEEIWPIAADKDLRPTLRTVK